MFVVHNELKCSEKSRFWQDSNELFGSKAKINVFLKRKSNGSAPNDPFGMIKKFFY